MEQQRIKNKKISQDDLPIINLLLQKEHRKFNPKAPWKNKRELDADNFVEESTPKQIYNEIKEIKNLRDRCLVAILYLCGCRIGEVVRKKMWKFGKKEVYKIIKPNGRGKRGYIVNYNDRVLIKELPSITNDKITEGRMRGINTLSIILRNEKNKNPKRRKKTIVIPLNNELNNNFAKIILQYKSLLEEKEELFPFEQRRAQQIINKLGVNPHFFRELRLTHLAKFNGFTDQQLVFFAGWTDSRPSKNYIKMRSEDLVDFL